MRARFSCRSRARVQRTPCPRSRRDPSPACDPQEAEGNWRIEVIKRLDKLKSLDGALIEDEEREQAKAESA